MKDFEEESVDTNNPTIEDDFVNSMDSVENNILDEEVTRLFDDTREQIAKVDKQAKQKKKEIVVNLAKDLDGKILKDSISAEIVTQLRGQVSSGFIRQCLGEEYKQRHRVVNARKQNRQQEPDPSDDLAKVTTLNQEAEDKKEVIILDVDGRAVLQENKDEQNDEIEDDEQSTITAAPSTAKHGSLTEEQPPHPQEQQQKEPEGFTYTYDYLNMKGPSLEEKAQS